MRVQESRSILFRKMRPSSQRLIRILTLLLGIAPVALGSEALAFDLDKAGASIGTPTVGGVYAPQFTRLPGYTLSLETRSSNPVLKWVGNLHFQPLTLAQGRDVDFNILDTSVQASLRSDSVKLWGLTPVFAFGPGVSYIFQDAPTSAQGNVRNAAIYLSATLTSGLRLPLFSQLEASLEVQGRWIFSQLVAGNSMLSVWTPSAGLHWKL